MQIEASIPYVNAISKLALKTIYWPGHALADRWEAPLFDTTLRQADETLHLGSLSPMDLLSLVHLPLRRNEWPISSDHIMGVQLELRPGSFTTDRAAPPHRMTFSVDGQPDLTVAFSEVEAENWIVLLSEIRETLDLFWPKQR